MSEIEKCVQKTFESCFVQKNLEHCFQLYELVSAINISALLPHFRSQFTRKLFFFLLLLLLSFNQYAVIWFQTMPAWCVRAMEVGSINQTMTIAIHWKNRILLTKSNVTMWLIHISVMIIPWWFIALDTPCHWSVWSSPSSFYSHYGRNTDMYYKIRCSIFSILLLTSFFKEWLMPWVPSCFEYVFADFAKYASFY